MAAVNNTRNKILLHNDPVRQKLCMHRLYTAIKQGQVEVVQMLLDGRVRLCDPDVPYQYVVETVGTVANTTETQAQLIRLLVESGCLVNERDKNGNTALHKAVLKEAGDHTVIFALLDLGADGNAKNLMGQTPLMLGAELGNERVVQLLLDNGVHVNLQDKELKTALHYAVREGYMNIATVRTLVKAGADVNMLDADGRSCLMYACERGYKDIVGFLIQFDPELNIRACRGPYAGLTALHHCFAYYGAAQDRLVPRQIVVDAFSDMVQLIVGAGAHLDVPDNQRRTFIASILISGFLGPNFKQEENKLSRAITAHSIPLPLTCLAARMCSWKCLKSNLIPKPLKAFIALHLPAEYMVTL